MLLRKETATDSAPRGWANGLRPACGWTAALLLALLPSSGWAEDATRFQDARSGAWANASATARPLKSHTANRQAAFHSREVHRREVDSREVSPGDQPIETSTQLKWRAVRKSTSVTAAKPRAHSDIQLTAGESEISSTRARYTPRGSDPFESTGPAARVAQSETRSVLGAQDPFEAESEAAPQLSIPDGAPKIERDEPFPRADAPPTVKKVDPFGDDPKATRPTPGLPTEEIEQTRPMPRTFKSDPMPGTLKSRPSPRDREAEANSRSDEVDCEGGRQIVQAGGLSTISLSLYQKGHAGQNYPTECPLWDEQFLARCWAETTYTWKASGLCHKPLYFEDVQLERYGHEWGPFVQPVVSAAHFFGTLPILPYKMGLETPNECVYALGYYRPNSCAPYMIEPIGFTWRAALFEAGAVVGAAAVLP